MRDDQEELVGHLIHVASKLAIREGLENGYRIVVNDGKDACIIACWYVLDSAIRVSPACPRPWWKEVYLAYCLLSNTLAKFPNAKEETVWN